MIGLMPAEIDSIDREARIARVRIPGLTDGATELPEAEFCNSIGDKSEHTEIRIKAGDRVWLAFVGGDPRYPVVVGYRPKNGENGIDWRRFEHANFEFTADKEIILTAGTKLTINAPEVAVNASTSATVTSPKVVIDSADTKCTGKFEVQGAFIYKAGMTGTGGASVTGAMTNNGTNIGSTHKHGGVQTGSGSTGTPS
jgi:phage gp45-like